METIVETIKQSYRDRQSLDEDSHWPPISSKEKLIKLQLVETEKEEGFRANLEQFGKKSLKPNKKEENSQQTSERDKKSKRFPILYNSIFKLQLVETEKEEGFRANLEQFGKKSLKPNKKEETHNKLAKGIRNLKDLTRKKKTHNKLAKGIRNLKDFQFSIIIFS